MLLTKWAKTKKEKRPGRRRNKRYRERGRCSSGDGFLENKNDVEKYLRNPCHYASQPNGWNPKRLFLSLSLFLYFFSCSSDRIYDRTSRLPVPGITPRALHFFLVFFLVDVFEKAPT